jgi:hypothetical protein
MHTLTNRKKQVVCCEAKVGKHAALLLLLTLASKMGSTLATPTLMQRVVPAHEYCCRHTANPALLLLLLLLLPCRMRSTLATLSHMQRLCSAQHA